MTLLRRLRIFWRRALILLQLKPKNYAAIAESELIWTNVTCNLKINFKDFLANKTYGTNWVAMLFWLVALGGPYLIYKCISQMVKNTEQSRKWALGEDEHYTAQVFL